MNQSNTNLEQRSSGADDTTTLQNQLDELINDSDRPSRLRQYRRAWREADALFRVAVMTRQTDTFDNTDKITDSAHFEEKRAE